MNKEMKKVPTVRFKGFTDDWEQRKLIEMLDQPITDGPHETPFIVDTGIPFISADAIVNNKIDFSRKRGYITEEYDFQCCKKYKPELYDVYLVKSGSTIGKVAIVETTRHFNIWSPLAAMRCKKTSDPYFLYVLLQTRKNQMQVKDKASNGTQPNLSMRELEKFNVIAPYLRDEQIEIGQLFRRLDDIITLHQRKLDQLRTLKKYFLQNMFPAKGEKVPAIRFKGFTGDWEQRKVSDIAEVVGGGTPSTTNSDYWNGNIDWYAPAEIGNQIFANGSVRKITEEGLKNSSAKLLPAEKTVLFTSRAGIGNMAILQRPGTTNQGFQSLVCHDDIEPYFVFSMGKIIKQQAERVASGSTFTEISGKKFGELKFMFPKQVEQKKIGAFFATFDRTITLQQRKLDQLQSLKKFMLQNLFI